MTLNVAFSEPVSAAIWVIDEPDQGMTTNSHIQSIIDNAQPGDTILFTGTQYTHIHLSINKPLNIISNLTTQLDACPSHIPLGSDDLAAFAIYDGASGTNISGFKINNNNNGYGIYINNTTKINISNNTITCSNGNGIKVSNSNQTIIQNNILTNSNQNGILIGLNVYDTLIDHNNITSNKFSGINLLESCNNVTITGNSIALNYDGSTRAGRGVYVNSTINGLNISSNFIYKNGKFGLCYDLGVNEITENTQTVENNYINAHTTGRDVIYFIRNEKGDLDTAPVWIGETCFGGLNNVCPKVHVSSEAIMSEIQQISPGKYSVSFIDKTTGLICNEFNSFYVTFFLNKNDTTKGSIDPGDVWKDILVENGTAPVDFNQDNYKPTNNTIFAIAPYSGFNNAMKDLYEVSDSDIPKLDLTVDYTIADKVIKNGETIIYQLKITNNNTRDANDVIVKNILSNTYYSSTALPQRGTYSGGVWNIGTIKAGETLNISINAKAIKSGTTKSQAQITGTNVNTLYSNTISKTINKDVQLKYYNTVSSSQVKTGKYVYLTSKVANYGKDVSDPVNVKIYLPSGIKLIGVNYPSVYNKSTKTWTYKVPAGKSYYFKVKAQVTSKGTKTVTFNTNGKKQTKNIKGY